jgi:hypothetical protein
MLQHLTTAIRGPSLYYSLANPLSRRAFCQSARLHDASQSVSRSGGAVLGQTTVEVDEDGIPLKPSYSIKNFLAGLPAPQISDEQFIHLHKLAALIPPEQGTLGFTEKKQALEEMVRLVEGVRPEHNAVNDASSNLAQEIPDGRIWPQGQGIQLDWSIIESPRTKGKKTAAGNVGDADASQRAAEGKKLLGLAAKQVAGYYVVKKRQNADTE